MNFDDLQGERGYSHWRAYGQSKLANLMFCFELQRRASAPAAAAAQPRRTPRLRGDQPPVRRSRRRLRAGVLMAIGNKLFAQSADMGALPTLYAATVPDLPGGAFVGPGGFMEQRGHPKVVTAAGKAYDELAWRRLWEVSEQLTGVHYEFPGAARGVTELRPNPQADRPADRRRRGARVGGALPGARRRAAGARAGRAGRDPRAAAGVGARRSPSRSPPCCATSTRCCCPGSRTGSTRATSPTSRPAPRSRRSSPSCWRRRSTRSRSCGARRRRRPSSRAWCSTGSRSCSGCPAGWHGHIEDTASTSTMAAIIAAREATGRDVIVCSEHAHSSVDKAARMLGMRLRKVPVDDEFRMRADALAICPMPPRSWSRPSARPRRPRWIRCRRSPTRARRPARGCTSMPRMRARRWSARSSAGRSRGSSAPTRWSSTRTSGCSRRWTARCCGPAGRTISAPRSA